MSTEAKILLAAAAVGGWWWYKNRGQPTSHNEAEVEPEAGESAWYNPMGYLD
jgi:hypothetical protein